MTSPTRPHGRAEGDEDAAHLEISAALTRFKELGAALDARAAQELLGEHGPAGVSAPRLKVRKTFMFTDIVGSTRLAETLGEKAWSRVLAWHDRTISALIEEQRGEVVKQLGDGFFAAFDAPSDAIECAVAIQRRLAQHAESAGFAPEVRIGLHAAEATRKDRNYEGRGVHEAARMGALAGAGEIVVSEAVLEGTAQRFPVSALSPVTVKGISHPIAIARIEPF